MNELKHILLRNQWVNGWEYGILRSFENTIARVTGAEIINYPEKKIPNAILKRVGHGMNKAKYRNLLPKTTFKPEADILWVILMGPENFELDLYKGWQKSAGKKILYLCDTLPMQMHIIKRLFSNNDFDICITAFEEAVPHLEKLTNRKWYGLVQAAPADIFEPTPFEERIIHFSAYGRRFPRFHEVLINFCAKNKLYYDYTTHDGKHPTTEATELYKQYAWHVSHSLFNISWPVELTNPQRAGNLCPITARWFEAGLGGCIIIGNGPDNQKFTDELCDNIVEEIDPFASIENIYNQLDSLWSRREDLFKKSQQIREANLERWSWEARVNQILTLLK
jgi:hypothetical protein